MALDADKEKKRRPRNHCWGSPKQGQSRDRKKPQARTPVRAPSPAPASPTPTAPVLELFPDEEDDFYQELTGFTGEEPAKDDNRGEVQDEAEELEAEATPPRTPVSPEPGNFGTSSPEPEIVTEEERSKPVNKRGRGSNGRWR